MRISIFGLGYVGTVCAASLSARGHVVWGVDISERKIELINRGESPIVESGLAKLILEGIEQKRLQATQDYRHAVLRSDLSMICVGTAGKRNGDLDLTQVEDVCRHIGDALREKPEWHCIVVRSTVLPGTVQSVVIPLLEQHSGKTAGLQFGVAVNPEFLRESTALGDYDAPPITVIGQLDARSGDVLAELYRDIPAPVVRQSIASAEMVKYTCNAWHATKVAFANEIGNIAKAMDIDGREIMNVVCQDSKLNISEYYLRPGFAFGGSCLPKDVRALVYRANQLDLRSPLLRSILNSNRYQVERTFEMIQATGRRKIAMLGLSFKAGTDDLRESPLVDLAELLLGKGFQLSIFDRNVDYARVHGANKDYINQKIPHLAALLKLDLSAVIQEADVIVLGNGDDLFETVITDLPQGKKLIDLVGFMKAPTCEQMEGICW